MHINLTVKKTPLVLDVQTDLLADLNTHVIVPWVPQTKAKKEAPPRLKPVFKVSGKNFIMMMIGVALDPRFYQY